MSKVMATPETNPRYTLMSGNNRRVYEQQNKYLYFFGFEYEDDLFSWAIRMNSNVFSDKVLEKKYINLLREAMENNERINAGIIDEKVFQYPDNADY
jgi:hypothetical protein|tara:strand:- start:1167 stop:1457 length:291 start_codon:yes stop_codon:yes gene_type:complete